MLQSIDPIPHFNVKVAPKKPYNKDEIDAIQEQIDERTQYLLQYYPDVSMKIDVMLTNLYSQLNSYNLNPPAPALAPIQTIPNKPFDPVKTYCLNVLLAKRYDQLIKSNRFACCQIDTVLGFLNSELKQYDQYVGQIPDNIQNLVKTQIRSANDIFDSIPEYISDVLTDLYNKSDLYRLQTQTNMLTQTQTNMLTQPQTQQQTHRYPTRFQSKIKHSAQFKIRSSKNPKK
jgi:hypothetical protein